MKTLKQKLLAVAGLGFMGLVVACNSQVPTNSARAIDPGATTGDIVAPTVESGDNSPGGGAPVDDLGAVVGDVTDPAGDMSNKVAGDAVTPTPESAATSPTKSIPPATSAAPTTISFMTGPLQAQVDAVEAPQGGKLVLLERDSQERWFSLDPHITTDNITGRLINEVFGGLVTLDLDLNVAPDLAESIVISANGRTYTFTLRKDAQFHDGKPVTAEDVRWSLERATDPATQSPVAEQYLSDIVGVKEKLNGSASTISGINVIDDRTIAITIDRPKAYFLAKLTYPTAFVLDRENVAGNGDDWWRDPNGTGPFMLAQYDVGEILRLTRNDDYHLRPAHLDEIEFILSGSNAMLMYENDEIHVTGVGLVDLDRVLDPTEALNADLQTAPARFSVDYIGLNVLEPPLDDPKFRLALNLAINRDDPRFLQAISQHLDRRFNQTLNLSTRVLSQLWTPANGIIPSRFPSYNGDLRGYSYDPERARRLLAESKYGGDLENLPSITMNVSGGSGSDVPTDLEVILASWEDVLGVQVEIQQTEWATFLQDLHDKRFQMFKIGWGPDYPDPENFLDILFHSQSDNNWTNYNNPEVDVLLEQARTEGDQVKRFELYNRIEQKILDDAPWVLLWNSGEGYALVKPEVKQYFLTPMTIPKYRYVYLSK